MDKLINLSGLKTLLEPIVHLINKKAERPDWNENDPSSADYIENKPFYTETKEDTIVAFTADSTSGAMAGDGVYFGYVWVQNEPDLSNTPPCPADIGIQVLQANTKYLVTYNGQTYNITSVLHEESGIGFLGNASMGNDMSGLSYEDNGLDFCYMFLDGFQAVFLVSTIGTAEVSIFGQKTTVHKIDKKYLPEMSAVGKEGNAKGAEIFNDYENNIADGEHSHAEGTGTVATGMHAHAEGTSTSATSQAAHAEGCLTQANFFASHAEGWQTIANGYVQHVQGQYNISDTNLAHIVGNGESDSARSNAHTLDWDGNAWFAGDVYVGGTRQSEGSKLITESELPDLLRGPEGPIGPQGPEGEDGTAIYTIDKIPVVNPDGFIEIDYISYDTTKSNAPKLGDLLLCTRNYKIYKIVSLLEGATGIAEEVCNIKGATGAQGPKGPAPTKGTDYWTAADQAEMVADMKELLENEIWNFTLADGTVVSKKVVVI